MLRINRIGLRAITDEERFAADLALKPGINIVQAGNTSGKSTCLQAIVYGLGLERMWGPRVGIPLAHAMQERIQKVKYGPYFSIQQSWVELEIENGAGDVLAIRRDVTGGKDRSLIQTVSTEGSARSSVRDFFVHFEGAAQREDGFHHHLARFIGWDLPEVSLYSGAEAPLYLETLFPMLFVEQKRGWSAVQGPFPTHLQIQDVPRRVMEFILDLEIGAVLRELADIRLQLRTVRERWTTRIADLRNEVPGDCRIEIPPVPSAEFALSARIAIDVLVDDRWIPIEQALRIIEEKLDALAQAELPSAQAAGDENAIRLRLVTNEMDRLAAVAESVRSERRALEHEREAIAKRLEFLREDLRRNLDAIRLKDLGSVLGPTVEDGHCPTCHQAMAGELLAEAPTQVMAVEENVSFLRAQIKLFEANAAGVTQSLDEARARALAVDAMLAAHRAEARALREALVQAASAPSRAHIAEIVRTEARRTELLTAKERATGFTGELKGLAEQHSTLITRQKNLEKEKHSPSDRAKLASLQQQMQARLRRFQFSSLAGEEVVLAEDNFRPVREQRLEGSITFKEFGLDVSGSDAIRVKWAYELALLAVARGQKTNHPGLLVIDEPGQHHVEWPSMEAFLKSLAEDATIDQQVIVATSEQRDLRLVIRGDLVNLLLYKGFILQPTPIAV